MPMTRQLDSQRPAGRVLLALAGTFISARRRLWRVLVAAGSSAADGMAAARPAAFSVQAARYLLLPDEPRAAHLRWAFDAAGLASAWRAAANSCAYRPAQICCAVFLSCVAAQRAPLTPAVPLFSRWRCRAAALRRA